MLKQGKKAEYQAYLKNSNYKIGTSPQDSKTLDNSGIRKQVSSYGNPYATGKTNQMLDKDSKYWLTKMSATIAQNSQENPKNVGNQLEKPHYATTKDIQFPDTNYESTLSRVTNDMP